MNKVLMSIMWAIILFLVGMNVYFIAELKSVKEETKRFLTYMVSNVRNKNAKGGRYEDPYVKEAVKNRILKGYSDVRKCYKGYLNNNPNVRSGAVKVDWEINIDGMVENVGIVSNLLGKEIEPCLVKAIKNWKFPKPIMRKHIAHTFDFTYKSDKDKSNDKNPDSSQNKKKNM